MLIIRLTLILTAILVPCLKADEAQPTRSQRSTLETLRSQAAAAGLDKNATVKEILRRLFAKETQSIKAPGTRKPSIEELLEQLERLLTSYDVNTDPEKLELLTLLKREASRIGLYPRPVLQLKEAMPTSNPEISVASLLAQEGFTWSPYAEPPYQKDKTSLNTPSPTEPRSRVYALGDCEGKTHILQSFIKKQKGCFTISEVQQGPSAPFIMTENGLRKEVWVSMANKDALFVFIGDTPDHGPDSLNFLRFLVELKKAFPYNVVLLLGNRDINKLRFLTELGAGRNNVNTRPVPLKWLGMPFEDAAQKKTAGAETFVYSDADGLPMTSSPGPIPKLKWMLENTMGAANAFNSRRQELQNLLGSNAAVNDDLVYKSLVEEDLAAATGEDGKDGLMRQYLLLADMFFLHTPSKTLFVHGYVGESCLFKYPSTYSDNPIKYENADTILSWLEGINTWAHEGILNALNKESIESKDIESLLAYVEPKNTEERDANKAAITHKESIVQNRYCGGHNNPSLQSLPLPYINVLKKNDIYRVVVGHTPYGSIPVLMKETSQTTFGNPFEVCIIDNSYSETLTDKNNPDFNSYVVIEGDKVIINGLIAIGGEHIPIETSNADPLVGYVFEPGLANIVARLPNGRYLVYVKRGFKSYYYALLEETIRDCISEARTIEDVLGALFFTDALIPKKDSKDYIEERDTSENKTNLDPQKIKVENHIYSLQVTEAPQGGPLGRGGKNLRYRITQEELNEYMSGLRDLQEFTFQKQPNITPIEGKLYLNGKLKILKKLPDGRFVIEVQNRRYQPETSEPKWLKAVMAPQRLQEYLTQQRPLDDLTRIQIQEVK